MLLKHSQALGLSLRVVEGVFGIEHVDEGATGNLALLLRIAFASQVVQERFFGVGTDDLVGNNRGFDTAVHAL
ncbi:hypothetical protein [Pseudomonas capsici]|uniref:hypothetical protein n=1 Tax=Pseudomonas capsici TaxID=2810614 RepID=UPI0021F183D5|nr:hypothetical protein [Pseudomonas capsici]MCV4341117.1 hypothetical protein [Pseudomonas capsici]